MSCSTYTTGREWLTFSSRDTIMDISTIGRYIAMRFSDTLKQYALITAGCALYALGFCWCCQPQHMSIGGLTGVAQVLNVFFPSLPVGTVTLVLNVPVFALGLKLLGKKVLISSLYAMAVSSLMIDGINAVYQFQPLEPVLAVVYGGVLCGAAIGLMLRQGATTGGTELIARLLKLKFQQLPIGKLCMLVDLVVIITYSLTFRQLTQVLYSIAMLYILTFLMDKVVYGGKAAKLSFIISARSEDITRALLEMDMGVTLLSGTGAYKNLPTQVVMCAFGRGYIIPVKKLVQRIDPNAFVIVCDTHEILGEGFGTYDPTGL